MRTMPLEHMVAPRGESNRAKLRVMGASVAALLSGALLVVVCVALLSQGPSQRRSIELESEQGILAAAERRGFEAGEREEAKRQLRLQELGRNGHLAKGQKFEGLVDTTGADFGGGIVSGNMIRSLIGCQKFKKPEFIKTCYENKMGHDRSFKSSSKQMLTSSPPPKSWPSAQSLAAPVTPSEVISPEMAIASAGTAVANAAQYHADGNSKDASEWSACFDEASGTGPCTAYTGSTSSFPPFAVRGKHPEQPYQRVKQMSPNQAVSNAVSGGYGDSPAWARTALAAGGAAGAAGAGAGGAPAEGGEEEEEASGVGAPTGSGTPEETPAAEE